MDEQKRIVRSVKLIAQVVVVSRKVIVGDWRFHGLSGGHLQSQISAAEAVETSVTNNSLSQDNNLDDQLHTSNNNHRFKPFPLKTNTKINFIIDKDHILLLLLYLTN